MATNPAGGSIYGDLTATPGFISQTHRNDTLVSTPDASYTVSALIALINAAVYEAGAVATATVGKASSVEAS